MDPLKSFILSKTDLGNRFVFDRKKNCNLLCNHLLYHILGMVEKGIDVQQWLDNTLDELIEVEEYGEVSKQEIEYYFQKYLFLKDNGYFGPQEEIKEPDEPFKPETIEYTLANSMQVTFEVTERCNLKCEYCGYGKFYSSYDARTEKDLDTDAAKRLIEYLLPFWNSHLNISHGRVIYIGFYGGEPLMNFQFINEIVEFCKSLKLEHNHFQFSMTTNTLLLSKYMDFLVENNFNLLFSLDGNEEQNCFRILKNGEPAFPHIIENIEAFREKYPDYFRERVQFNAVVHTQNSVVKLMDFFKEKYDKIPRVGELKNVGIREASQNDFWKMYSTIKENIYNEIDDDMGIQKEMFLKHPDVQAISLFLLKYSGFVYENYNHLLSKKKIRKMYPTGTCMPFAKRIFVTASGKLLPCETIAHQFHLGTVTDEKVEMDFSVIAANYNRYFKQIAEQCTHCYNREACTVCIFNMHHENGHITCKYRRDYAFSREFVSRVISAFEREPTLYTRIMEDVTIE